MSHVVCNDEYDYQAQSTLNLSKKIGCFRQKKYNTIPQIVQLLCSCFFF